MRLIVTDEEKNFLINNRLLKKSSQENQYELYLKESNLTEVEYITVEIDSEQYEKENNKIKIEDVYKRYMEGFPIDIEKEIGSSKEGVSLRSGNKKKILSRLTALLNQGYLVDDIINAVKYEIWFVKKTSTLDNNKLTYVQRAESWINNQGNLDTMIQRYKQSQEFNDYLTYMSINPNGKMNGELKHKAKLL